MCAAAAGTGLSWTSPVLDELKSPNSTFYVTKEEGTWIAAYLPIGALFGALPSGLLADKIGRRSTAILICAPYIASWLMIIFAKSVGMIYLARFIIGKFSDPKQKRKQFIKKKKKIILIGVAVGGSCVVIPLYISEFAETSIRGTLGTFFQLLLTIGIFFVFCAGAVVNWTRLSCMCLAFPIVSLVGLFFLPESPIWLLKNVSTPYQPKKQQIDI